MTGTNSIGVPLFVLHHCGDNSPNCFQIALASKMGARSRPGREMHAPWPRQEGVPRCGAKVMDSGAVLVAVNATFLICPRSSVHTCQLRYKTCKFCMTIQNDDDS